MEDAEVDDVEDAINLDDNGSIESGTLCIDLIVMDADEFLEKAEKERLCCYFPGI